MKKSFNAKTLIQIIILALVASVFYFIGNSNVSINKSEKNVDNTSGSEMTWETSVGHVSLNYPGDKFQIYEPEPYPGDITILSNFSLLDKSSGEPVIDGTYWNETKRSGIEFEDEYVTKNRLKAVTIGKGTNIHGGSFDIKAYMSSEKEDRSYYYFAQGRGTGLYVLELEVLDNSLTNNDIKNVILSTSIN